jgi:AcrR family transcriptional regulator
MPKIVDKKEKSRAISAAALKVFRELGYPGTRMVDIAQRAGIGKGTLYEYFKDKADILRFAFDAYFTTFARGAFNAMKGKTTPSDKLMSLIDFSLHHASEWEDHCAVYVDYYGAARTDGRGRFSLSAMYGQMRHVLLDLIRDGQAAGEIAQSFQPAALAEVLLSIFDGIILHRIFEGRETDPELLGEAALQLVKKGLMPSLQDGNS